MTSSNALSPPPLRLEELIELVIDYRGKTPKKLGGDFTTSGVPVISAIHLKGGRIVWEERERFVSEEMFKKWMKVPLRKNDVLLSSEAPLGEVALVPSDEDLVLSQRLFAIRTNSKLLDPRFLKYFFQSEIGQNELRERASGSTVVGIKQSELLNILVAAPALDVQQKIGAVLSALEEKIETNRLLAETLEQIAQTIFKSWFIDFDPVKAKMAGEKPVGMDDATAALFPDSMEESELGPIPMGWKCGTLEDAMLILDSKRIPLSSAERKKRPGNFPYYGATGILDFIDSYLFEGPHVLVGEDGSVITKDGNPYIQYVWGRFWVSNHAHVLQGSGGFSVEQLKLFLDRVQISNYVTGAVQPKLNQGNLKSIPCLLPEVKVSDTFNLVISPMFEEIRLLSEQTTLLVETRDRLLPRLISGELPIPEEMLAS
jgi:type I restriction enzyme S subunit